jgi:hypothetical protein
MTITGGKKIENRNSFDWVLNARQQIGIVLSRKFSSQKLAFESIFKKIKKSNFKQIRQNNLQAIFKMGRRQPSPIRIRFNREAYLASFF